MARRKRPSEERGWFKVSSDILEDEAIIRLGTEGLGVWIRLLAMLNRQRSSDGVLRISINGVEAITGKRRRDVAETWLERLANVGLTSWERDGDVYEITVPKWSKYNGIGSNNRRSDVGHQDQDQDQDQNLSSGGGEIAPDPPAKKRARKRSDGRPPTFSEDDDGAWFAPQLTLAARATEAERDLWLECRFPEIAAAARAEAEAQGGSVRDRGIKIGRARWLTYLKDRDPARRQFAQEARYRDLQAAKAAVDRPRQLEPPDPAPPDDDPLALLRAGVNPHVSN